MGESRQGVPPPAHRQSPMYREQRSVGDHTASLGLRYGSSFGTDLPVYKQFALGGPFGFAGLAESQFRGSYQGIGSIGTAFREAGSFLRRMRNRANAETAHAAAGGLPALARRRVSCATLTVIRQCRNLSS